MDRTCHGDPPGAGAGRDHAPVHGPAPDGGREDDGPPPCDRPVLAAVCLAGAGVLLMVLAVTLSMLEGA